MELYSTRVNGSFDGGNFVIKSNVTTFHALSGGGIACNCLYGVCRLALLLLHFRHSIVTS
jgi:hypothetical protein